MTLSNEEAKRLNQALLSAYAYDSLERMLFFELGKRLQLIAPPGNLQVVVFAVITTAEMEGWTNDLIHAAHDANPGNQELNLFTSRYVSFQGTKPTLERIIEKTNSFLDVAKWRRRLERIEHQVCSIEIAGEHVGTGFLIGHDLVMTNHHVVEDLLGTAPKCQPQQVRVRFDFMKSEDGDVLNDGVRYTLDVSHWLVDDSPYSETERQGDFAALPAANELDYAVLRIAPRDASDRSVTPGNEPVKGSHDKKRGWIEFPPETASFTPGAPLFIMQHPDGKPLKMALNTDSIIGLNGNGTRVRHKTNTEPGSSGSPCFNSNWELVALHHAGDPRWHPEWNQAVPVSSLRAWWLKSGKLPAILGSGAPPEPTPDGGTSDFYADDEVDEMLQ
jgi:hypothetical protein